ncbi:GNAT family N-acetyltransferase [Chroococcidiopsis sp. CCALA 051]|uniref:GNAT family N-acetyltransferase n=1 Tax=Chroococcidiopsis sp. CCALA 051 TaxID=869949 RepID=UPI000D0CE19D|nr:GNAT family N-acetyltransferase [Chroococcidiopsis sp. CCALA 051]MBE9019618.1 GNAT family N-acetyltransferase [Chroococcidiopsidales cyanobacterium LEGE 13417]PSM48762.1 GNAT family N-acetyltransferase [Chroococcidiopsis sp. CCALA 051]
MSRNFDINLTIKVAELPEDFSAMRSVRAAVFQLEQRIEPELDFDGKDETSDQIVAYINDQPIGTARIRYLDDRTAKIERLAVLPIVRGKGIGKLIMEKAIELAAQKKMQEVVIHSQEYIQGLHQKLGFEPEGAVFEEAGIPHVKMRKKLGSTY